VIYAADFSVNEALLTGESRAVKKISFREKLRLNNSDGDKKAKLTDREDVAEEDLKYCRVFKGSYVLSGKAKVIVSGTGLNTKIGEIAQSISTDSFDQEMTPLQKKIKKMSWLLTKLMLLIISVVIAVGFFFHRSSMIELLTMGIALSVAAIPEGLVIAMTVVLAVGMRRMLRKKALVRRLVAAETLGTVSVICTDKTGTLTEGKMSVAELAVWDGGNRFSHISLSDKKIVILDKHNGNKTFSTNFARSLLELLTLNNNAEIDKNSGSILGDETDGAILGFVVSSGIDVGLVRSSYKLLKEIPFSSERKFSASFYSLSEGTDLYNFFPTRFKTEVSSDAFVVVKGAPEIVEKKVLKDCCGEL